jgi:hypothetical protein
MTTRVLLAAVAATASLVACGGEDPQPASSTPDRQAQNRKAMLDYARCMRENGIDMPDPQFEGGGGRVFQRGPDENVDRAKLRKADQACQKYIQAIKPPELSEEDRAKFQKQAVEHARCMREHGIDIPDPQFDEDGGIQLRLPQGTGINDPKLREAQEACRDTMPGFGRTRSGER